MLSVPIPRSPLASNLPYSTPPRENICWLAESVNCEYASLLRLYDAIIELLLLKLGLNSNPFIPAFDTTNFAFGVVLPIPTLPLLWMKEAIYWLSTSPVPDLICKLSPTGEPIIFSLPSCLIDRFCEAPRTSFTSVSYTHLRAHET